MSGAGANGTARPLLSIDGLSVRFGGIVALDGVSFAVESGQICGLIGPNGAGKTTLFNCLSRLYQAERGDILFEGRPCWAVPQATRIAPLGIGRTFQNLALFRTMTVRENIMVGGHCRGARRLHRQRAAPPLGGARGGAHRSRARDAPHRDAGARSRRRDAGRRPAVRRPRSASSWRARWPASPSCCCSTSPPAASTTRRSTQLRELIARDPRPARRHRAAGRASHEPRHARLGQGRRARFRPQDRRRHAGRGAARSRGDPRLSREAR